MVGVMLAKVGSSPSIPWRVRLALTLKRELLNFQVKVDPKTAHGSYEYWSEDDHDDFVLETALSCW